MSMREGSDASVAILPPQRSDSADSAEQPDTSDADAAFNELLCWAKLLMLSQALVSMLTVALDGVGFEA